MADPLQASDLWGANGLGFLVHDTDSSSETDRKRITNDAYVELASIKGYWRLRSTTSSLTAGTYQYNLASDFSDIFRIYYRQSGTFRDIEIVSDSEWLELSRPQSSDAGTPQIARITQTSATQNQIELSPAPSSSFISGVASSLTYEYFIEITRLVNDSDEPILPANLRHLIVDVAGHRYALAQGDLALADRLEKRALSARSLILKQDLTRTGRPRKIRPISGYEPAGRYLGYDYR